VPARTVAIRAVAPVTSIGIGADAFAEALDAGRCGLDEIVGFDVSDLAVQVAGEVQDFDLTDYLKSVKSYVDRASAFGLAAAALALRDAGWEPSDADPIGLVLGTEWGCLESMELFAEKITKADPKFAQPLLFTQGYANAPNSLISIEFGLRGTNACFSCGRTSGAAAIAYAFDQIRHGRADRVLAGGVDVLSRVLCASQDGRAFGPLGEAAGLLALGPGGGDDEVLLLGAGLASGERCGRRAMEAALRDAQLDPDPIAIILACDPAAVGLLDLPNADPRVDLLWMDTILGDTMGASGAVAACAAALRVERGADPRPGRVGVVCADLQNNCAVLIFGRAQ